MEEENPVITKPVAVGVPKLMQDDSGFAVQESSELKWDVPINVTGRTVISPTLSVCPRCDLPVLIYGRMVSEWKEGEGKWRTRKDLH